jgi:hypothetical protein
MADVKISAMTNGNPAQSSDAVPTDRVDGSGINESVTAGSIADLNVNLASCRFFLTDSWGSITEDNAQAADGIGGQTIAVNFVVPTVIRKVSLNITTASAGSYSLLAIYTLDGTVKLGEFGSISTAATGIVTAVLGTPLRLPAGEYLFSWYNSAGNTVRTPGNSYHDLDAEALANANAWRYARTTSNPVGAVMPASLGGLNAPSGGQQFDVPAFLFE